MKTLHKWDLSYSQARQVQVELAGRVRFTPLRRGVRLVAGLDCAFSKDGKRILAAVVVLRMGDFELVETTNAVKKVTFPYIPGLLSFREAPVCLAAVEKLKQKPDVFIIDGQGIAHPRRLGLAAHLGLFFGKPTIGCAKSRLCGEHREVGPNAGNYASLKLDGKTVGAVVRTRAGVKPGYVSVGHRIDLKGAIRLVLRCTRGFRIPEPTRQAHLLVNRKRKAAADA